MLNIESRHEQAAVISSSINARKNEKERDRCSTIFNKPLDFRNKIFNKI